MSGRTRVARALMYLGIVAVVAATSKVHAAYVAKPPYDFTGSFRFAWALAFMAMSGVAAYGVGLPDLPRSVRSTAVSAVLGSLLASLAMSVLQLVLGDALLPRFVVASSALLLVPWYMMCTAIASAGHDDLHERDKVVVVASAAESATMQADMTSAPERPVTFSLALTLEQAAFRDHPEALIVADVRGRTARPLRPLVEAVHTNRATIVVLSRTAQVDDEIVAQAAVLHGQGVRIRTVSLFYEEWLGKLPLAELERTSLMFDIGELHRQRYTRAKRVFDVVLGVAGLVVLLALMPVIAIVDVLFNRGSLFYRQPRVGKNGEVFEILKFRTMRTDEGRADDGRADDGRVGGTVWTADDDPRITPFGRLLRRSHLDELPQVWNILRGDLSVVGPRPEQPHYVAELATALPFYDMRHLVRPGLTGWAQVKYHYGADVADAMEKLQYEFFYLRHQSLTLDARIIGRTVRSVLGREGR